jgi:putative CocE/NonD family hydrolase
MRAVYDQMMPMRDGALMNYDLYQPDNNGRYPAILMRTPYTKSSLTMERIYSNFRRYVDHGYCVIVSECRGTGKSEGVLDLTRHNEYEDGYDTVEWIASQPWCTGQVGMTGLSFFGFTQLAAASLAPPSLKAICPFMTQAVEPFGTQITQTFNYGHLEWIYGQLLSHPETFIKNPVERARLEPVLRKHQEKLQSYALLLPADRNPAALVQGVALLRNYIDLVDCVESSEFWTKLRHPTDFSRAHTAMLHCTGWFDVCRETSIHNWQAIQDTADRYTADAQRLIIGPWSHGGEFNTAFGDFDFGADNDGAGQDINGQMLNWFDHHIKGRNNEVSAWSKVRYFVLGANQWRTSGSWPPAESVPTAYYLHVQKQLDRAVPAQGETPDEYTYDPMDPAPCYAPAKANRYETIPDYSVVADRADTLTYETQALESPLTLAGTVRMRLYAITDAADTDFTCRLVDVYPGGFEFLLAQGLIRAKWRKGLFKLDHITPGEIVAYDICVGNIACRLEAGHTIKLHVSSALFPLYDRNLNTGEPSGSCGYCVVAHQKILHDADYPSHILLPILPD